MKLAPKLVDTTRNLYVYLYSKSVGVLVANGRGLLKAFMKLSPFSNMAQFYSQISANLNTLKAEPSGRINILIEPLHMGFILTLLPIEASALNEHPLDVKRSYIILSVGYGGLALSGFRLAHQQVSSDAFSWIILEIYSSI